MNPENYAADLSTEELQRAICEIIGNNNGLNFPRDGVVLELRDYIRDDLPQGARYLALQLAKSAIFERVALLWLNNDGAVKEKTNIEHLVHIMEFSRHGALMQMLVVDLLVKASKRVAESAPSDYPPNGLISPEAWISCAKELQQELSRKYGEEPAAPKSNGG